MKIDTKLKIKLRIKNARIKITFKVFWKDFESILFESWKFFEFLNVSFNLKKVKFEINWK